MLITIVIVIILSFGLVVFFGAPYLPTLDKQKTAAMELLSLKPGQTMIEAGSGDGRVLKAAAERGLYAVGYELNPILVIVSWFVTLKHRDKVRIVWGNYWSKDWHKADGVYAFLYAEYMKKLDEKMLKIGKRTKLVSIIYRIPGKKPVKEKDGVFLYQY
jgi:hypothetical protein